MKTIVGWAITDKTSQLWRISEVRPYVGGWGPKRDRRIYDNRASAFVSLWTMRHDKNNELRNLKLVRIVRTPKPSTYDSVIQDMKACGHDSAGEPGKYGGDNDALRYTDRMCKIVCDKFDAEIRALKAGKK